MKSKVKWGILLIIIGILFQLQTLELIESITTFWPSLVIVAGILLLFDHESIEHGQ